MYLYGILVLRVLHPILLPDIRNIFTEYSQFHKFTHFFFTCHLICMWKHAKVLRRVNPILFLSHVSTVAVGSFFYFLWCGPSLFIINKVSWVCYIKWNWWIGNERLSSSYYGSVNICKILWKWYRKHSLELRDERKRINSVWTSFGKYVIELCANCKLFLTSLRNALRYLMMLWIMI